jgi:alpha-2-macroglobulin
MKNFTKPNQWLSYILFFFLILGCSKKEKVSNPEEFSKYLRAYTAGTIKSHSKISIRFSKISKKAKSGEEISGILEFTPKIPGKAIWKNNLEIAFIPDEPLPNGTKYQVRINLSEVFDVDEELSEFLYEFVTISQDFELEEKGFITNEEDFTMLTFHGIIHSADFLDSVQVKEMLAVKGISQSLNIKWNSDPKNNIFSFAIQGLKRLEEKQEGKIILDGKKIGIDKSLETPLKIPSIKDFSVLSIEDGSRQNPNILVIFSDPLDPDQSLEGLIELNPKEETPTYKITRNQLKIYVDPPYNSLFQLKLGFSIKNQAGYELPRDYFHEFQYITPNPEVRLVDSKTTILTTEMGGLIPFEAVSLKMVDIMVLKIFDKNVHQYLQVNDPGGENELKRVGRPVYQGEIDLASFGATNLGKWNRYYLDLKEYVALEPGAYYKVKVDFRPQHSLFDCNENLESIDLPKENYEAPRYAGDYYYSDYYYYYDYEYDWQQRDNPCNTSYFLRTNKSASKIFQVTDIGLIAKRNENGKLTIFTTNLISAKPLSGVSIDVFDYQNQLLASGKSDKDGKWEVRPKIKGFLISANWKDQYSYLKLNEGNALSLSDFNVSGQSVDKGLNGFFYAERGVWRPGDTVHLHFILDTLGSGLPPGHPVKLRVSDPKGNGFYQKTMKAGVGGIYRYDIPTEVKDITGRYPVKVKVGGRQFSHSIRIETIKPNRLKLTLKQEDTILYATGNISAELRVQWMHGAPVQNLKTEVLIDLKKASLSFKGYENYNFNDFSNRFDKVEDKNIFQGNLDFNGNASFNYSLSNLKLPPPALKAKLKIKVFEEGGGYSFRNFSYPFYPYDFYTGIKTPENNRFGYLETKSDQDFQFQSLDKYGNPAGNRRLKFIIYKMSWRWWWDMNGGNSQYVYRENLQILDNWEIVGDQNGIAGKSVNFSDRDWGRYLIAVIDLESGHVSSKVIFVDWPWGRRRSSEGEGGATRLQFWTDKEKYQPGETLVVNVPSSSGGNILVSLESGPEVLETFWVKSEDQETRIEIPITAAMAPNVYLNLSYIQAHTALQNSLPLRMYGVHGVGVKDPNTILRPKIEIDEELKPNEIIEIVVSEKNERSMAYSIAIVDEGLLDITNFKTPNPWKHFFAREALGVKTWDLFDQVSQMNLEGNKRILAIGGDEDLKQKEEDELNRFKPVVKVLGPFVLKSGQKGIHKFQMPNYIGRVKTMIVAASSGAYGKAYKSSLVRQPVMVLATLPRVLGPQEKLNMPVNLFSNLRKSQKIEIKVSLEGQLESSGSLNRSVTLEPNADTIIYFPLNTKNGVGRAKMVVEAGVGSDLSRHEIELMVRSSTGIQELVKENIVQKGETMTINYKPLGIDGTNLGVIEISALPPLNLQKRVEYLVKYPYGCSEQVSSAGFGQIYLGDILNLSQVKKQEIRKNVVASIKSLKSMQASDGGFGWWPGAYSSNPWISAYVYHYLVSAKDKGFFVSDWILNQAANYNKKMAREWRLPSKGNYIYGSSAELQAYRTYALALSGKAEMGAMNKLRSKSELSNISWLYLAGAYAYAGREAEARAILGKEMGKDLKGQDSRQMIWVNKHKQKAILLEIYSKIKDPRAHEIIKQVSNFLGNSGTWMSTHSLGYSLQAIGQYIKSFDISGNLEFDLDINNERISFSSFSNPFFIKEIKASESTNEVRIKNNSNGQIFARLTSSGSFLPGTEPVRHENVSIEVLYKNKDGSLLDVKNLKSGTTFYGVVTVRNPGTMGSLNNLALSYIFPSGWEIQNLDFKRSASSKIEYQDVRDDRIYSFINLQSGRSIKVEVPLVASYTGEYYLPGPKVEGMYSGLVFSNLKGQKITVGK